MDETSHRDNASQTSPKATSQQPASLRARVASGAGWMLSGRLLVRLLGLVNTIIVARLLAPEDFGLVAIAVTAMQLLHGFTDIGVSQAVVRFRDANKADMDTLFTLSAVRGVFIAIVLVILAPVAAAIYEDPRVAGVFMGAALFPLLTGFINPRFFEFERDLDFSKEFFVAVANKLAGVTVSIAIAVAFRSYWAIIFGLAMNALVELVLSYAIRPYKPSITLASFKKVIGFTGWITGVAFMAALNNKLDALIIARLLGQRDAGNFYVGTQLADLPTSELAVPMARAVYPGLSSLQGSPERMRKAYLSGVEALGAIAMPAGIGFALVAPDLINVLLGEKWRNAAPVISFLAPIMGVQMLFLATQFYAMAMGLTRLIFIRELIYFILRTPLVIWGIVTNGFFGALVAVALAGVFHAALNLALYARISGRSILEPIWVARRSFISVAVMATSVLGFQHFGGLEGLHALWRLMAEAALGALVYGACHYGLWHLEGTPAGAERSILELASGALGRITDRH